MAQWTAILPGPVKRVLLALLVAYLLLCVLAWLFQRQLLFLPTTSAPRIDPGDGAEGLRNVQLRTSDGLTLEAWYWAPAEPRGTVLLFHGNAGNRGDRLFWMRRVHALGWAALVPDYRGYGGSEGSPSEQGLYQDGEAAWAWARESAPAPIVLAGTSVGSGVAVELARRHAPAGLLLTAAPPSVARVGQDAYPFLPVLLLMRDRFDNAGKVAEIACPLLMLHGAADEIVGLARARELFERAREPKQLVVFPGCGHNDIWFAEDDGYWRSVRAFLDPLAAAAR